jgi:Leucine-rich repeat (LRR) protein
MRKNVLIVVLFITVAIVLPVLFGSGVFTQKVTYVEDYVLLDGTKYPLQEFFAQLEATQPTGMILTKDDHVTLLPQEMSALVALEIISIRDNPLAEIPTGIGALSLLRMLEVSHGDLTSLPSQIGGLYNLTHLKLNHNKLSSLPSELGNLVNLEVLDLRENKLKSLPESVSGLTNLRRLYLGGNPIGKKELARITDLLPDAAIYH